LSKAKDVSFIRPSVGPTKIIFKTFVEQCVWKHGKTHFEEQCVECGNTGKHILRSSVLSVETWEDTFWGAVCWVWKHRKAHFEERCVECGNTGKHILRNSVLSVEARENTFWGAVCWVWKHGKTHFEEQCVECGNTRRYILRNSVLSVETREDTFPNNKCNLCYLALIIDNAVLTFSSKCIVAKPPSLFDRVVVCYR